MGEFLWSGKGARSPLQKRSFAEGQLQPRFPFQTQLTARVQRDRQPQCPWSLAGQHVATLSALLMEWGHKAAPRPFPRADLRLSHFKDNEAVTSFVKISSACSTGSLGRQNLLTPWSSLRGACRCVSLPFL